MSTASSRSKAPPPKYQLKLLITQGRANPPFFTMHTPIATLGSSGKADVLLRDPSIAPAAAMIQQAGDAYVLRNLGPPGSVLLNGKPIDEAPLKGGADIQIGHFRMRAEITAIPTLASRKEFSQANVQVTVDVQVKSDRLPGSDSGAEGFGPGNRVTELMIRVGEGGLRRFLQSQFLVLLVVLAGGYFFLRHSMFLSVREAVGIEVPTRKAFQELKRLFAFGFKADDIHESTTGTPTPKPRPLKPSLNLTLPNPGLPAATVTPRAAVGGMPQVGVTTGMPKPLESYQSEVTGPRPRLSSATPTPEPTPTPGPSQTGSAAGHTPAPTPPSRSSLSDLLAAPRRPPQTLEETLKSHKPDAACGDFMGFALLGEERPDPTGSVADPKKRDAGVGGIMEKLRLDIESDYFALLSSDAVLLRNAYRTLGSQDKYCRNVGDESPRCVTYTAARLADLVLFDFGYRASQSPYATRTQDQADQHLKLLEEPRIKQHVSEKLKDVLRGLGFSDEMEAVKSKWFPWVKAYVSRLVGQRVTDEAEKRWVTAKIESVELDLQSCQNINGLVTRLVSGSARYVPDTNKVVYCPSRMLVNTSRFHLVYKLARLVARSVGPCHVADLFPSAPKQAGAPKRSSMADGLAECFRSQGSVWAALMSGRILSARLVSGETENLGACIEKDVYDSAYADWVATSAVAEWAQTELAKSAPAEMKFGLRNVWRARLSLQNGNEAVLAPLYRLDGIFAANPAIRALLGCPKDQPHPRFKHCP